MKTRQGKNADPELQADAEFTESIRRDIDGLSGTLVYEAEPTREGFTLFVLWKWTIAMPFGAMSFPEPGSFARMALVELATVEVEFDRRLSDRDLGLEIVDAALASASEVGVSSCVVFGHEWLRTPEQWSVKGTDEVDAHFARSRWDEAAKRLERPRGRKRTSRTP